MLVSDLIMNIKLRTYSRHHLCGCMKLNLKYGSNFPVFFVIIIRITSFFDSRLTVVNNMT